MDQPVTQHNISDITYFAETNFRGQKRRFGIKIDDRRRHMYLIGKTGMGKTTLMEQMIISDIYNGHGVGLVDPHGDFVEKILDYVPSNRINDIIYFNPADQEHPIGFNVMEAIDPRHKHLVASGLMGVFKKIWPDVWSPRMEYILNNCILALLEYPDSTLLGINRMLSDKSYRDEVVENISDPVVKAFWTNEFAKYSDRFMTEASAAIQNKVGQFISNPLIRNIIGQSKSSFDIRDLMDKKKIFLMNLSKGRIGEENSRLIGAMLITKIYLAAMSRVDIPESDREDFYLYVDEFQNFANESFKDILSEARKYRLNLILAHQYIAQMEESIRDAVFGNIGTLVTFRVGAYDAETMESEFAPEFEIQDIVGLGFGSIYLKLMIDGMASRPFSAGTLPPIKAAGNTFEEKIIEDSRDQYATSRKEVDEKIAEWHAQIAGEMEAEKKEGGTSVKKSIPHPGKSGDRSQVYEAVCSVCGKKTYVPFQPDGKRAIYCKAHRNAGQQVQHQQKNVRTMNSSFQKSPDLGEETIHLSELGRHKKAEPKLDELRKVLGEVLGDEEPASSAGRDDEEDDYEEKTGMPIGGSGWLNTEKKPEEKEEKKILKPGEKIKFGK